MKSNLEENPMLTLVGDCVKLMRLCISMRTANAREKEDDNDSSRRLWTTCLHWLKLIQVFRPSTTHILVSRSAQCCQTRLEKSGQRASVVTNKTFSGRGRVGAPQVPYFSHVISLNLLHACSKRQISFGFPHFPDSKVCNCVASSELKDLFNFPFVCLFIQTTLPWYPLCVRHLKGHQKINNA